MLALLAACAAQAENAPEASAGATPPAPTQRPALRGALALGPFSLFDTNHDGKLSPAEIAAAPEVLRRYDKNQDGCLTTDELPGPRPPPRDRRNQPTDAAPPPPPPLD